MLYNGKGNFVQYTLSADNTFETMGLNEFLSNRYFSVFYQHNFGKLLFKTKKFQPEIIVINNAGWGNLNNPNQHKNAEIKIMNKGFFETGIKLNNLLKINFTGIGAGFFYRYGPYAYSLPKNNLAIKTSVTFVF
jgi:hypothetical protein